MKRHFLKVDPDNPEDAAHRLLGALKKDIGRDRVLDEIRKGKDAPLQPRRRSDPGEGFTMSRDPVLAPRAAQKKRWVP
jgi:hypothetical protein